tara:strand:- start:1242 stop:1949 length:708 start_codon:yes stop_codon:yes gene_type:complete
MKIVFTGGSGRFGTKFKKLTKIKKIFFPTKNQLNILNLNSIENYIKKIKPKIMIHAAGLSRPMDIHEKNIKNSIDLNIIGTCNVVKVCSKYNIKIIYLSTSYVYPGKKGNYTESSSLLPFNNYSWSKLGGECAVQMYKNSLIVRLCMTEKPFLHKLAFKDFITNFIFHEDIIKIFPKLIKLKGIINVGGKTSSVYTFAKKYNKNVKAIKMPKSLKKKMPKNFSMNIKQLKLILND